MLASKLYLLRTQPIFNTNSLFKSCYQSLDLTNLSVSLLQTFICLAKRSMCKVS